MTVKMKSGKPALASDIEKLERKIGRPLPKPVVAFSGWLFRERPERNIIQHPIYDVFVRSCTMRWPGETDPEAADGEDTAGPSVGASDANRRSSAPQRAEPASAPANAPAPAAPAPAANGAEANSESADNAR